MLPFIDLGERITILSPKTSHRGRKTILRPMYFFEILFQEFSLLGRSKVRAETNENNLQKWFWVLALLHVVFWTITPAFLHYNAPLDVAEAIAWGQQWQWGYDRDPYLVGWLAYCVSWLTGHSVWATYCLSQICIIATFWAISRLAMQLTLSKSQALASVLLLEAIFYYNFATPEFNDNVLQLPLWALSISFLYSAISTQRTYHWVLTGLSAGLALMAKYYTVMLFLPMLVVLLGTAQGRKSFKMPGFYCGIALGLIIVLPNLYWQYQHSFQYVGYALSRAAVAPTWSRHLSNPFLFFITQLLVISPCFLLYVWSIRNARRLSKTNNRFDRFFLFCMTWGPFITTLGYAAISGTHMRSMWGMPLFSLVGLWLVYTFWPTFERYELRRLTQGSLMCFFSSLILYVGTVIVPPYWLGHAKIVSYPSQELANAVIELWHKDYQQPLPFVAGTRQLAARVNVYGNEHPIPFFDWDNEASPWVDTEAMRRTGAVFVWDAEAYGDQVSDEVRQAYPSLRKTNIVELPWHTKASVKPVRVGIALLPPSGGTSEQ